MLSEACLRFLGGSQNHSTHRSCIHESRDGLEFSGMNKLAAHDINSFRTAQELSSSEPAQLKRTIAELEARIMEQDSLIAQQNEGILSLSQELQQKKDELHAIKKMGGKPDQGLYDIPEGFEHFLEKERLEKANKKMEALIDEFEDGFWTLFSEQRQGLDECLKALEQLPSTPETKSLYAHVKKEWQAIEAAKKTGHNISRKRLAAIGRPGAGRCNIHPGQAKAEFDHCRDLAGRGPPRGFCNGSQIETAYH